MPDIDIRLGRDVLVIDGAMGTMLQRGGVPPEQCPEQLNVTAPEIVEDIHHNYVLAGADCVSTNTFGGTRAKLDEYGLGDQVVEFNRAGVRIAKRSGAQHVLADVGPTGRVLEPLGRATFDELFALFVEQIEALVSEGPDGIFIETMTDIAEARCAVLAARFVTDLPVLASVSFGLSGRMELSGTDPATAAIVLEAAGASAVGMNCGLGPDQMLPLVEQMAEATSLPIIVQPNAGLPTLVDGATVFPGTPDELGLAAARFVELGASLVGSCCGSTPAFTGAIVDFAKSKPLREGRLGIPGLVLAGPRGSARIGRGLPFAVIGERINPTGKKRLAESLREGSMAVVREFAIEQQDAGAHLLDVNVGAAGVDAVDVLRQAVLTLTGITDLPLVLDNTDPAALEPALRAYPGRALINSVNGGDASMNAILPLARRYGAAVVVLALDDSGIPATTQGRLEIIDRIRRRAHAFGLRDDDLIVDCLTLTAATDPHAAATTLDAVRTVSHEWGLATVLGVSNVSHGLPGRPQLNAAFLAMAAGAGLNAAIVNPGDVAAMSAVSAVDAILGCDTQAERWIARVATAEPGSGASDGAVSPASAGSSADALVGAIQRGDVDSAPALVDDLVRAGQTPQAVISEVLTPAIQSLGDAYGRGEVFLPQLIAAADAMKAAVERAKSHLPAGTATHEGHVVFGTVKGDIHSIGKDICVSMLESQGFLVEDLGVDVSPERFVEAAAGADVVCLSALMTTTLSSMERTVTLLAEAGGPPAFVGGAVVTADYAASIGAGYSTDAPGCVRAVREAIAAVKEGTR